MPENRQDAPPTEVTSDGRNRLMLSLTAVIDSVRLRASWPAQDRTRAASVQRPRQAGSASLLHPGQVEALRHCVQRRRSDLAENARGRLRLRLALDLTDPFASHV